MYSIKDIVYSLILTISIYSLPLWIYKLVTKKTISKKKAKWITIIYAIFAYIIMSYLLYSSGSAPSGGSIFLWSFINYKVLSKGADDSDATSTHNDKEICETDNSGYYEGDLIDEYNASQQIRAYLDFRADGSVYLLNYVDNDGKLHTLSTPKKYSAQEIKDGISYKFKLTKNNTAKTYKLTVPGFDYYGQIKETVKIIIFNCEQIKIYEEISNALDTSQYPPDVYTDDKGYYFAIEKNTNDTKLCICTQKEWLDFVKPIVDEIGNISYTDFLKYTLDNLQE